MKYVDCGKSEQDGRGEVKGVIKSGSKSMESPEAPILHPGHNEGGLPGSPLGLLVRDHLGQVWQGALGVG